MTYKSKLGRNLTIYLSYEDINKLDTICKKQTRSRSNLVKFIIQQAISRGEL